MKKKLFNFKLILTFLFVIFLQASNAKSNSSYSLLIEEDYKGAIDDYGKAIEINPHDSTFFTNSGVAKLKLGDFEGSIHDNTIAIKINPNNAYAFCNRGIAKEFLGDFDGAIVDWEKSSELGHKEADKFIKKYSS